MTGSTLLERLRAGDVSALAELYDETSRRAFGVAHAVLRDDAEAEDAVQEAYIWVWEHADRLDPARGRVESLVLTIVHRRAIDAVRRRARGVARAERFAREHDGHTADAADANIEALDNEPALESVRHVLDSLPDEQRAPIELAYFEGLTQQAVAERLGIPLGTVKSRLRLALGKLRAGLAAPRAGTGGGP
ncbi:MAG: sigma-70 family RNA polymerase sigma factor [Dehalococcoidia bacterium]